MFDSAIRELDTDTETRLASIYSNTDSKNNTTASSINANNSLLVLTAEMGVARCNIRNGKHTNGVQRAKKINDAKLYIACGDILEQEKQYMHAVDMYQCAQQYEKAGNIYVKFLIKADRNRIAEAAVIMEKVQNTQLNLQFAKMCFTSNKFVEAMKAYERAKDFDKVCVCMYFLMYDELCIFIVVYEHLNNLNERASTYIYICLYVCMYLFMYVLLGDRVKAWSSRSSSASL
jgi:hypothetical protein